MSSTYTLLFFFLSTAPPLFYTLSLHDALPIFDLVLAGVAVLLQGFEVVLGSAAHAADRNAGVLRLGAREAHVVAARSEEHTSELQSRGHLVCRLLLEKKKTQKAE